MISTPFPPFTGPAFFAGAEAIVKITLVFVTGQLVAALLRNRSAAARHFVWALTLGGAVMLALLLPIAPRIDLPIPAWTAAFAPAGGTANVQPRSAPVAIALSQPRVPVQSVGGEVAARQGAPSPVLLIWLAGFGAVILWCAIGHWGLVRIARRAATVDDRAWLALLEEAARQTGVVRPVRLLRSSTVGAPMTWGVVRPVILLPEDTASWSAEQRRMVLLHELAHVARLDYLVQLLASAACALYWFHPAAWMASRRLRHESERDCDDRALACGTPAVDYASHLLSIACRARSPRLGGAMAIGMARRSALEARLLSVLDESVTRRAISARARVAGALLLALTVTLLAALTPVGRAVAAEVRSAAGEAFERSVEASPGERLELSLEAGGSVVLQGWDEGRVLVRARLGGRDADDVRIAVERQRDGVKVRSFFARTSGSQQASNALEIRVPRRFDLDLSSAGGSVKMTELEGTFRGRSGGGQLVLERVNGEADLATGGGDVHVTDCDLEGKVSTGGGRVVLSHVRGGLRGWSGSGPVISGDAAEKPAEEQDVEPPDSSRSGSETDSAAEPRRSDPSTGVLHVEKAGGSVELDEAPEGAVIHTGGGHVIVGRAAGLVDSTTGGGNIDIGPVSGSVRASTGSGDVHVLLADAGGERQTVDLTSGTGQIVVELPAGFDGVVELETAYTESLGRTTRIDSVWELEREATTAWSDQEGTPRRYVRARGVLGKGHGLVRVKTVNGDIELRRAPR